MEWDFLVLVGLVTLLVILTFALSVVWCIHLLMV